MPDSLNIIWYTFCFLKILSYNISLTQTEWRSRTPQQTGEKNNAPHIRFLKCQLVRKKCEKTRGSRGRFPPTQFEYFEKKWRNLTSLKEKNWSLPPFNIKNEFVFKFQHGFRNIYTFCTVSSVFNGNCISKLFEFSVVFQMFRFRLLWDDKKVLRKVHYVWGRELILFVNLKFIINKVKLRSNLMTQFEKFLGPGENGANSILFAQCWVGEFHSGNRSRKYKIEIPSVV